MQDNVMQVHAQPYIKLVQANMELFTQFSTSPEVTSQAGVNPSQLFQQASQSATNLMQSGAFARLLQGMLKNYTEFVTEVGQSAMSAASQVQASLVQQVQTASESAGEVVDVAEARGRRRSGS
jgi:hypothetical protein